MTMRPWMVLFFAILLGLTGCKGEPEPEPEKEPEPEIEPDVAEEVEAAPAVLDPEAKKEPIWTPEGKYHSAFDLLHNRFLAHGTVSDGFAARLGPPWGAKYIRAVHHPDWALDATKEDVPVTIFEGRAASLVVPLTEAQASGARHISLYLWNAVAGQEVSITLNGESVGTQPLEKAGWANVDLTFMAGLAREGENDVVVSFSNLGRIASYQAGGGLMALAILPSAVEGTVIDPKSAGFAGTEKTDEGLKVASEAGLAWYLQVPTDGVLGLQADGGAGGCSIDVIIRPQGAAAETISVSADDEYRWADVSRYGGQLVRFELQGGKGCAEPVLIREARLQIPGDDPLLPESKPPRNVIVWLVDTLRADHLSVYNPETDVVTPNFDAFAKTATVFDTAYVEGNESKVSHSSFFTGLYPIRHKHYRSSTILKDKFEIIPEAMQRSGRPTGGFISNGYISDKWGFKQGWDRYVNTIREGKSVGAENLLRIATPWIKDKAGSPFFVYFGTIDPHVHYFRHEEFIDLYDPLDKENMQRKTFEWKASGGQMADIAAGRLKVDDQDKARVKALYKNEITWNDKYFGKMLELLDELGIRDETMIIVLADHGEEFWEHGGIGHARTLYQHTVHVPLMISYPAMFPPGKRVEEAVDILDIYPTIVNSVELRPAPEGLQGGDLLALAHDVGAGYPRPTVATMGSRRYVWRLGQYKLHIEYDGEVRLFDLSNDWWEGTDLLPDNKAPYAARWLQDTSSVFLAYRRQWDKQTMGVSSNLAEGFEEASRFR